MFHWGVEGLNQADKLWVKCVWSSTQVKSKNFFCMLRLWSFWCNDQKPGFQCCSSFYRLQTVHGRLKEKVNLVVLGKCDIETVKTNDTMDFSAYQDYNTIFKTGSIMRKFPYQIETVRFGIGYKKFNFRFFGRKQFWKKEGKSVLLALFGIFGESRLSLKKQISKF